MNQKEDIQRDIALFLEGLTQDFEKGFKMLENSNYPLTVDQIEDEFYKKVFEISRKYYKQGHHYLTEEMLRDEWIEEDDILAFKAFSCPEHLENMRIYFKRIESFNYKQTFINVMKELDKSYKEIVKDNSFDKIKTFHEKQMELFNKMKSPTTFNKSTTLLEIHKELYENYETNEAIGALGTGLEELDDLIGGGFERSGVNVIAGPPGSGKTTLALQIIINNVLKGKKVLFISSEMTKLQVHNKILSALSALPYSHWRKQNSENEIEHAKKAEEARRILKEMFDNDKLILEFEGYDKKGLLSRLRKAYEIEKVDLVIIDFLQRMKISRKNNDYSGIEEMVAESTDYIKNTNMALVWLSQLTKDGPVKNKASFAKNSEIRFAPRLNQDAYVDLRIWRDETDDNDYNPEVHIYIKKTRFGTGLDRTLDFSFDGSRCHIGMFKISEKIDEMRKRLKEEEKYMSETEKYLKYGEDDGWVSVMEEFFGDDKDFEENQVI